MGGSKFISQNKWHVNSITLTLSKKHCVKSVGIRSYSGPYFPAFGLNTERIRSTSPYLVRMWENTVQNNSGYGHFWRSVLKYMEIINNHYLSIKNCICLKCCNRYFPVKFSKFFITPILKNICERPLLYSIITPKNFAQFTRNYLVSTKVADLDGIFSNWNLQKFSKHFSLIPPSEYFYEDISTRSLGDLVF